MTEVRDMKKGRMTRPYPRIVLYRLNRCRGEKVNKIKGVQLLKRF